MGKQLFSSSEADRRAEDEMQAVLDRHLPGRKPVSIDDYDWQAIRPEAVDQDMLDAMTFVTLVECNPDAPAQKLLDAADRGPAPWLRRFIEQTWLPEERMHHAPYKEYLIRSGLVDADTLDFQIEGVRSRGFIHGEGYTPLQAATYGWIQELITWRFYDAMHSYLVGGSGGQSRRGLERSSPGLARGTPHGGSEETLPADPVLLRIVADVAKQENFHRHVYLTGAKTILKYAPHRKGEVVAAMAEFLMPGHHMVPDLQPLAGQWASKFNFQFRRVLHDLCEGLVELTGYNGLGQATVLYASRHKLPWFVNMVVRPLAPLARTYGSPLNYLGGRLLARLV